jgi:hypothetical protein
MPTINDLELTERLMNIIQFAHQAQSLVRNGKIFEASDKIASAEDEARKAGYRVNDLIAWRKK